MPVQDGRRVRASHSPPLRTEDGKHSAPCHRWSGGRTAGRPEGIQIEPALLTYVSEGARARPARGRGRRREWWLSKRLDPETVERLVAEYSGGTAAADVGRRYGVGKNSVLRLVRAAGKSVRHPRLSVAETAQLLALYESGLSQKDIAGRLGRSPSAVWHCLRRAGLSRKLVKTVPYESDSGVTGTAVRH
jgi:DNA-binding CsgD family transcriptional regulator